MHFLGGNGFIGTLGHFYTHTLVNIGGVVDYLVSLKRRIFIQILDCSISVF